MKKIFIFLGLSLSFISNVHAASMCDYKEQVDLKKKAANIKREYEVASEPIEAEEGETNIDIFRISILNLTEEFYAVVTNNINDDELTLTNKDAKDGIVTFDWKDISTMATFSIKIYTSDKTGCPDEAIKSLVLTTPRVNKFYNTSVCEGNEEFTLCQKYVTSKEITQQEFLNMFESYKKGKIDANGEEIKPEEKPFDKVKKFISDYKWYLTIGIAVVVLASGTIIIIKKNKQRKLG